jgi:hypothetical protein
LLRLDPGHVGLIYQASNALYAGRGTPRSLLVLPDGRVLNERALAKVRTLEPGHAYVEETLERFGAPPRRGADPAAWLRTALAAAGVRRLAHPGNHRYLFRLGDRAARRSIAVGLVGRPTRSRSTDRRRSGSRRAALCRPRRPRERHKGVDHG